MEDARAPLDDVRSAEFDRAIIPDRELHDESSMPVIPEELFLHDAFKVHVVHLILTLNLQQDETDIEFIIVKQLRHVRGVDYLSGLMR